MVNKINFTIKGRKTITLVRQSGSSKSIVFKLLQWFINPNKRDIKINSQNTYNVTLSSLQDNIAIIP